MCDYNEVGAKLLLINPMGPMINKSEVIMNNKSETQEVANVSVKKSRSREHARLCAETAFNTGMSPQQFEQQQKALYDSTRPRALIGNQYNVSVINGKATTVRDVFGSIQEENSDPNFWVISDEERRLVRQQVCPNENSLKLQLQDIEDPINEQDAKQVNSPKRPKVPWLLSVIFFEVVALALLIADGSQLAFSVFDSYGLSIKGWDNFTDSPFAYIVLSMISIAAAAMVSLGIHWVCDGLKKFCSKDGNIKHMLLAIFGLFVSVSLAGVFTYIRHATSQSNAQLQAAQSGQVDIAFELAYIFFFAITLAVAAIAYGSHMYAVKKAHERKRTQENANRWDYKNNIKSQLLDVDRKEQEEINKDLNALREHLYSVKNELQQDISLYIGAQETFNKNKVVVKNYSNRKPTLVSAS